MTIQGELVFDETDVVQLGGAAMRVSLLDVSRSDDAATTVAEYCVAALPPGMDTSRPLPFSLGTVELSDGRDYTLAAHIGLARSRKPVDGDFITMESVPVRPHDPAPSLTVLVRRICP